jgi:hypothetical protein
MIFEHEKTRASAGDSHVELRVFGQNLNEVSLSLFYGVVFLLVKFYN